MGIDSLLEPASSGHSRNCSFWHFRVGLIFQPQTLPLGRDKALYQQHITNSHCDIWRKKKGKRRRQWRISCQSLRNISRLHAETDLLLISTSNRGTQSILPQTAALHPYHRLGVYKVKELHTVGREKKTGNRREIKRQGNHTVLVFSHTLWMAQQETI